MISDTCAFEGCWRKVQSRGYCKTHYEQLLAGATLRPIKEYRRMGSTSYRDQYGRKECGRCRKWKHTDQFSGGQDKTTDGLYAWCKTCALENNRLRRYKLTRDDLLKLLQDQNFQCAICFQQIDIRCNIDHDHACCPKDRTCGACVRGLLCTRCNQGIGNFSDEPEKLRSAATYLEKWAK